MDIDILKARVRYLRDLFNVRVVIDSTDEEMDLARRRAVRSNAGGCFLPESSEVHLFVRDLERLTPQSMDVSVLYYLVATKGLEDALGPMLWDRLCLEVGRRAMQALHADRPSVNLDEARRRGAEFIGALSEASSAWQTVSDILCSLTGLSGEVSRSLCAAQTTYWKVLEREARLRDDAVLLGECLKTKALRYSINGTRGLCDLGRLPDLYGCAELQGRSLSASVKILADGLSACGLDLSEVATADLIREIRNPLAVLKQKDGNGYEILTGIGDGRGGYLCIPMYDDGKGQSIKAGRIYGKTPWQIINTCAHEDRIAYLRPVAGRRNAFEMEGVLDAFRKMDMYGLGIKGDAASLPEHSPVRCSQRLNSAANIVIKHRNANRDKEIYTLFGINRAEHEKFDFHAALSRLEDAEARERAAKVASAAVPQQPVLRSMKEKLSEPLKRGGFTQKALAAFERSGLRCAGDLLAYTPEMLAKIGGARAARDAERYIMSLGIKVRPSTVPAAAEKSMAEGLSEMLASRTGVLRTGTVPMPCNADGRYIGGSSALSLTAALAANGVRWEGCSMFLTSEEASNRGLEIEGDAVPCRIRTKGGETTVYNVADTSLRRQHPEAFARIVTESLRCPAPAYYIALLGSLKGSDATTLEKYFNYMDGRPATVPEVPEPAPLFAVLAETPDLRVGRAVRPDREDSVSRAAGDPAALNEAVTAFLGGAAPVSSSDTLEVDLRNAGATDEECRSVLDAVRTGVPVNAVTLGNGNILVLSDNMGSEEQVRLTYIHERTHSYLVDNPALMDALSQEIEPGTERSLLLSLLPDKDTISYYEGKDRKAILEEAVCFAMEKALSVKSDELSRTLSRAGVVSLAFIDFMKREDARMRALLPADPFRREPDLTPDVQMDIWAGAGGSHRELSNMAARPFEIDGRRFNCVEQYYQYRKAQLAGDEEAMGKILAAGNGFEAKTPGSQVRGLDVARWDAVKEGVMKEAMRASFGQNPDAAAALLATGDATLTHRKDPRWSEAFPRLLMEVRMEMKHGYDIVERKATGTYLALRHNPEDCRMWADIVDSRGASVTGFTPEERATRHLVADENGMLALHAHTSLEAVGPDGEPYVKTVCGEEHIGFRPDYEALSAGGTVMSQVLREMGVDSAVVNAWNARALFDDEKGKAPQETETRPDGVTVSTYAPMLSGRSHVVERRPDGTMLRQYCLKDGKPRGYAMDCREDGSLERLTQYGEDSEGRQLRSSALIFSRSGGVDALETLKIYGSGDEGDYDMSYARLQERIESLMKVRMMAPNGQPSRLTRELYDYVRTPEFIARYGDWMHGRAHMPLDVNGEPLVLWHGSTASFDRFDLSHAGDNTGLVEYTDRRTGEKILSDSDRALFFTSERNAAISYAFLAKTQECGRVERDLRDIASLVRTGGKSSYTDRIKTRKQLVEEVEFLRSRGDAYIDEALKGIDMNAERPVGSIPEGLREGYAEKLQRAASVYSGRYRMNDRGGLSNQLNNISGQMEYLDYFRENIGRLCANDPTVMTEHGEDFNHYNQSFFSPEGRFGVSVHFEDGRMKVYGFRDEPVYMDTMTEEERKEFVGRIASDLRACVEGYNRSLAESGYGPAVHLYPVFLRTENPLEHDYRGSAFPDKYKANEKYDTAYIAARQVQKALRDGNDAVVYRNVRDPFMMDTYGVFSADRIEMLDPERFGLRWDVTPDLYMAPERVEDAVEEQAQPEVMEVSRTEAVSSRPVEVTFSDGYRKGEPQASPDTAFLFTENAEAADYVRLLRGGSDVRYTEGYGTFDYPHKAFPKINVSDMGGRNSAGIRTGADGTPTPNAFGIVVKKYQQDAGGRFVSQEGCFGDTDAEFEQFRRMNGRVFGDVEKMSPARIVLPRQMGLGKAALPLRFCEWLGGELAARYGVESEVRKNLTAGYEGYGLEILGLKPMEDINMEKNMEEKAGASLENNDEARRLATDTAMFLADKLNSVGIRTVVVGRDEAERALLEMSDSAEFSVADIQRLNYEWNGESISLKVFAQTFGDLIKQKDRTAEDVERIAKAYINSVKENPSAFIPQLKAEKMSHWRYFVLQDGSIYTDAHMLAQSPEYQTQRGLWSIYSNVLGDRMAGFVDMMKRHDGLSVEERAGFDAMEAEVSASHLMQSTLEVNAQKVNERRNRDVANLIQYFDDNTDYTSAEKAIILKGVMTYSYSEKKKDGGRNEVKLVRITDANDISIPVIGGDAASVVEGLRKGLNFKASLILARSSADDGRNRSVARDFTGWKVYPKSDREEDAVVLNRDAAGTGWCTGGSVSTARTHLSGGDFHIYFENGEPLIAIRTENGRLAEAPRGAHEGQFCKPREEEIAFAYIQEGHGIEGGSEYVADMEDLRRLNDPGCTWRDIVMMPSRRRYKNGEFGGYTRSWGEVALAKMRSLMSESREERFAEGYYTPQEMAETGASRDRVKVLLNDETFKLEGSWPNLEHIKGNIDVTDNTFLSNCKSIGGDVGINSGQFTAPQLSSIGGSIEVVGNFTAPLLSSIGVNVTVQESGQFEAPQLSSIGGYVDITSEQFYAPQLSSIGWYVIVCESGHFEALQLESIGGNIIVNESGHFEAPKLSSIGGGVWVYKSGQFEAIQLASIGGYVEVYDSGQFKAPQLESIGGYVRVYELAHFEAPQLESIGGYVEVWESGQFTMPQLASIGGYVTVHKLGHFDAPKLGFIVEDVHIWESGHFSAPKLGFIGSDVKVSGYFETPQLDVIGGSVDVRDSGRFDAPQLRRVGGDVSVQKTGHFSAPKLGVIVENVYVRDSGHFDAPQLKSVNGDVVVEFGQGYFNAPLLKREFHLQDGTVYGYEYDNTIYLAPEGINPNTPIHEYAHLWAKAMQRSDPQKWTAIKDIVRGSEVWEQIKRSENYAFIHDDEDRLAEEALATAVGDSGEKILLEAASRVVTSERMKEEDRRSAVVEELKSMVDRYVAEDLFEVGEVAGLDMGTITLGVMKSLVEQRNLNDMKIKQDNTMDIEKTVDEALAGFRSDFETGFITEEEMNGKAVDFITEALGGHATAEQLNGALSRNGYKTKGDAEKIEDTEKIVSEIPEYKRTTELFCEVDEDWPVAKCMTAEMSADAFFKGMRPMDFLGEIQRLEDEFLDIVVSVISELGDKVDRSYFLDRVDTSYPDSEAPVITTDLYGTFRVGFPSDQMIGKDEDVSRLEHLEYCIDYYQKDNTVRISQLVDPIEDQPSHHIEMQDFLNEMRDKLTNKYIIDFVRRYYRRNDIISEDKISAAYSKVIEERSQPYAYDTVENIIDGSGLRVVKKGSRYNVIGKDGKAIFSRDLQWLFEFKDNNGKLLGYNVMRTRWEGLTSRCIENLRGGCYYNMMRPDGSLVSPLWTSSAWDKPMYGMSSVKDENYRVNIINLETGEMVLDAHNSGRYQYRANIMSPNMAEFALDNGAAVAVVRLSDGKELIRGLRAWGISEFAAVELKEGEWNIMDSDGSLKFEDNIKSRFLNLRDEVIYDDDNKAICSVKDLRNEESEMTSKIRETDQEIKNRISLTNGAGEKIFLLGGHDLEMLEIRRMLDEVGVKYYDNNLAWGASVKDYAEVLASLPEDVVVYGVELSENGTELPANYRRIDHHGDYSDREASILQVAAVLGVKPDRRMALVAANDAGYIPAMKTLGATDDEIREIRLADRAAQGVTREDEAMAAEAVAAAQRPHDGFAVVRVPDALSKFSPITDTLFGTRNILIYNGNELCYYGPEAHSLGETEYAGLVKDGRAYYGGSKESGYFGLGSGAATAEKINAVADGICAFLKKRYEYETAIALESVIVHHLSQDESFPTTLEIDYTDRISGERYNILTLADTPISEDGDHELVVELQSVSEDGSIKNKYTGFRFGLRDVVDTIKDEGIKSRILEIALGSKTQAPETVALVQGKDSLVSLLKDILLDGDGVNRFHFGASLLGAGLSPEEVDTLKDEAVNAALEAESDRFKDETFPDLAKLQERMKLEERAAEMISADSIAAGAAARALHGKFNSWPVRAERLGDGVFALMYGGKEIWLADARGRLLDEDPVLDGEGQVIVGEDGVIRADIHRSGEDRNVRMYFNASDGSVSGCMALPMAQRLANEIVGGDDLLSRQEAVDYLRTLSAEDVFRFRNEVQSLVLKEYKGLKGRSDSTVQYVEREIDDWTLSVEIALMQMANDGIRTYGPGLESSSSIGKTVYAGETDVTGLVDLHSKWKFASKDSVRLCLRDAAVMRSRGLFPRSAEERAAGFIPEESANVREMIHTVRQAYMHGADPADLLIGDGPYQRSVSGPDVYAQFVAFMKTAAANRHKDYYLLTDVEPGRFSPSGYMGYEYAFLARRAMEEVFGKELPQNVVIPQSWLSTGFFKSQGQAQVNVEDIVKEPQPVKAPVKEGLLFGLSHRLDPEERRLVAEICSGFTGNGDTETVTFGRGVRIRRGGVAYELTGAVREGDDYRFLTRRESDAETMEEMQPLMIGVRDLARGELKNVSEEMKRTHEDMIALKAQRLRVMRFVREAARTGVKALQMDNLTVVLENGNEYPLRGISMEDGHLVWTWAPDGSDDPEMWEESLDGMLSDESVRYLDSHMEDPEEQEAEVKDAEEEEGLIQKLPGGYSLRDLGDRVAICNADGTPIHEGSVQETAMELGVFKGRIAMSDESVHPFVFYGNSGEMRISGRINRVESKVLSRKRPEDVLQFTESSGDYAQRTKENAYGADLTLAFAKNFSTGGETLTAFYAGCRDPKYLGRRPVPSMREKYVPCDWSRTPAELVAEIKEAIARLGLEGMGLTLNIAGNGIYTFNGAGISQEAVDTKVYETLRLLREEGVKILAVRSGGQSGADEAGAKAGVRLGVPTEVHAPKGYIYRLTDNKDIADEAAFKARFAGVIAEVLKPAETARPVRQAILFQQNIDHRAGSTAQKSIADSDSTLVFTVGRSATEDTVTRMAGMKCLPVTLDAEKLRAKAYRLKDVIEIADRYRAAGLDREGASLYITGSTADEIREAGIDPEYLSRVIRNVLKQIDSPDGGDGHRLSSIRSNGRPGTVDSMAIHSAAILGVQAFVFADWGFPADGGSGYEVYRQEYAGYLPDVSPDEALRLSALAHAKEQDAGGPVSISYGQSSGKDTYVGVMDNDKFEPLHLDTMRFPAGTVLRMNGREVKLETEQTVREVVYSLFSLETRHMDGLYDNRRTVTDLPTAESPLYNPEMMYQDGYGNTQLLVTNAAYNEYLYSNAIYPVYAACAKLHPEAVKDIRTYIVTEAHGFKSEAAVIVDNEGLTGRLVSDILQDRPTESVDMETGEVSVVAEVERVEYRRPDIDFSNRNTVVVAGVYGVDARKMEEIVPEGIDVAVKVDKALGGRKGYMSKSTMSNALTDAGVGEVRFDLMDPDGKDYEQKVNALVESIHSGRRIQIVCNSSDPFKAEQTYHLLQDLAVRGVDVKWIYRDQKDTVHITSQGEIIERAIFPNVIKQGSSEQLRFGADNVPLPVEGVVLEIPEIYKDKAVRISGNENYGVTMGVVVGKKTSQTENIKDIAASADFMISFGGKNAAGLEGNRRVLDFKTVVGHELDVEKLTDKAYARRCAEKFIRKIQEHLVVDSYEGGIVNASSLTIGFTGQTGAELATKPFFRKSATEEDLQKEGADVSKGNVDTAEELNGLTQENARNDYGLRFRNESDRRMSFGEPFSEVEFSDIPNADFSTRDDITPLLTFMRSFIGYLNDPDLMSKDAYRDNSFEVLPGTEEMKAGAVSVANVGQYAGKVEEFEKLPGAVYIGRRPGARAPENKIVYDGNISIREFVDSLGDPKALVMSGGNLLGNPFTHKDDAKAPVKMNTRAESVEAYGYLYDRLYGTDKEYTEAVDAIYERVKAGEDITFGCWCKPAPCHGDVLKARLEKRLAAEMKQKARRSVQGYRITRWMTDGDNGLNIESMNAAASLGLECVLHPTKDYKLTRIDGEVLGNYFRKSRLPEGTMQAVYMNRTKVGLRKEVTKDDLMEAAKESLDRYMTPKAEGELGLSDRQLYALHFAGVSDGDISILDRVLESQPVPDWETLSRNVRNHFGPDEEYLKMERKKDEAEKALEKQANYVKYYNDIRPAVVRVLGEEFKDGAAVPHDKVGEFVERVSKRLKDEEKVTFPKKLGELMKDRCAREDLTPGRATDIVAEFEGYVTSVMEKREKAYEIASENYASYGGVGVKFTPEHLKMASELADADVRRHAERGEAFCSFKHGDYPSGWYVQRKKWFEENRITVLRNEDGSLSARTAGLFTKDGEPVKEEGIVDHVGEGADVDIRTAALVLDTNPLFLFHQGPLELLDGKTMTLLDDGNGRDENIAFARNVVAPGLKASDIIPVVNMDGAAAEKGRFIRSATSTVAAQTLDEGGRTVMFSSGDEDEATVRDIKERNVAQGGVNIRRAGTMKNGEDQMKEARTWGEKNAARAGKISAVLNASGIPYLGTLADLASIIFFFSGKIEASHKEKIVSEAAGMHAVQHEFTASEEGMKAAMSVAQKYLKDNDEKAGEKAEEEKVVITRPNYDTVQVVRYEDRVHLFVDGTHENVMAEVQAQFKGPKVFIHDTSLEPDARKRVIDELRRRAVTVKNPADQSVETIYTERDSYHADGAEELIKPVGEETLFFVKGRLYDLQNAPDIPKGIGMDLAAKSVREQTLPAFDALCDAVEKAWDKVKADAYVGLTCDVHTAALHPVINRVSREIRIMEGDSLRCRVWIDAHGSLLINESAPLVNDAGDSEGHAVFSENITGIPGVTTRNVSLYDYKAGRVDENRVNAVAQQIGLSLLGYSAVERKNYALMDAGEKEELEKQRHEGRLNNVRKDNVSILCEDLDRGALQKAGDGFDRATAYIYATHAIEKQSKEIIKLESQIKAAEEAVEAARHALYECPIGSTFDYMDSLKQQLDLLVDERDNLLDTWRKACSARADIIESRDRICRANVVSFAQEGSGLKSNVILSVDNVAVRLPVVKVTEENRKKAQTCVNKRKAEYEKIRKMERTHLTVGREQDGAAKEESYGMLKAAEAKREQLGELRKKIESLAKQIEKNEGKWIPESINNARADLAELKRQADAVAAEITAIEAGFTPVAVAKVYDIHAEGVVPVGHLYSVPVEGGVKLCRPDGEAVTETLQAAKPIGTGYLFVKFADGKVNILDADGKAVSPVALDAVFPPTKGQDEDVLKVMVNGEYNILNLKEGRLMFVNPETGVAEGFPSMGKIIGRWAVVDAAEWNGEKAFARKEDGTPRLAKVDKDGKFVLDENGCYIEVKPGEDGRKVPLQMFVNTDGKPLAGTWLVQAKYEMNDAGEVIARFVTADGREGTFNPGKKTIRKEDISWVTVESLEKGKSNGITPGGKGGK